MNLGEGGFGQKIGLNLGALQFAAHLNFVVLKPN
jgi:hypothetical protein